MKPSHTLAGGAALLAMAAAATPALAKDAERRITLHARGEIERVSAVDNAPAGTSAGDVLVFTERLLDRRGRRIGSDAAICTRLFDATMICTGHYRLRRGMLMVQLHQPGDLTSTYDQAITGGTGRFARARGTVTVAQRPGGDRFTFRIRVPR